MTRRTKFVLGGFLAALLACTATLTISQLALGQEQNVLEAAKQKER